MHYSLHQQSNAMKNVSQWLEILDASVDEIEQIRYRFISNFGAEIQME